MPPLVLIAAAWAAGLFLAHYLLAPSGVEPAALLILAVVPLAATALWWRDRPMRLASVCALALIAGALRYQADLPDWTDQAFAARYNDSGWLTVEGVVRSYPDVRDTWTNLRLGAETIEAGGQVYPVHGTILVRAPRLPEYGYGDRLRVSGAMETPPEIDGFSYEEYLARQGIYSFISRPRIELAAQGQGSPVKAALFAVKDRARAAIARLVPEPEASLLQGIVLGVRASIARDLYDLFNATGASHILVISGANLTIVAALFSRAFGRLLGKRWAYWLTLGVVGLYALLVGAEPAVARAALMAGLYLTALYLGRQATAYVSLCAAGLLLTAINPFALWDVGFQLSFAATLGLILFTPALDQSFERALARVLSQERAKKLVRYLDDLLIVTLAAQILTLPLILYHFGRLSLVAPLANLLILPAQTAIIVAGGLATLVGLVAFLQPIAQAIFWVPWLGLAYTTAIVRWLASWPLASVQLSPARAGRLALYYMLFLAAIWAFSQGCDRRLWSWMSARLSRRVTTALLGVLAVAAILACLAVLQLPDGRLHVAFLNVGEGDAILITTPRGQQILVDGGPSPTALTTALGQEMPFWDRSLDLVVMTHADADHITGLVEALRRYQVDGWLDNGYAEKQSIYEECEKELDREQVPRYTAQAGAAIDLGDGAILAALNPMSLPNPAAGARTDSNDQSVVLRLTWGRASVLLTGDIGAETESALLRSGQPLSASVLKVAHHGSNSSSTAGFLSAVQPSIAVISAGAGNRFGHPAPAVLERLAE
ncbi:MAG: DNA internalization-related competence protein ComEC/Rec2, partial [Anaerolineae bacterium]|nr:DNA internalization-related competence protein ComEC/Rec2 [Anaerolineae bacterium]